MAYRVPPSPDRLIKLIKEVKPLAAAFDLIDEHIVITDENGYIVYANKAAEKKTGFFVAEIIGKTPGDLWGGKMSLEFYKDMWCLIKDYKQTFVGEVLNIKKDGTEYWQELRIYPVLDEGNNIEIFIGLEPDITVRKNAEAAERKKYEELEHLNAFMVGRELKMEELKKEITRLKAKIEKKNKNKKK